MATNYQQRPLLRRSTLVTGELLVLMLSSITPDDKEVEVFQRQQRRQQLKLAKQINHVHQREVKYQTKMKMKFPRNKKFHQFHH